MSLGEFEFLADLKHRFNLDAIGDDCAVIPKDDSEDFVISSDMLVEDVDFRRSWMIPRLLGQKAAAVSISDIAAMCGAPRFAMLSLAIPSKLWNDEFLDAFYAGFVRITKKFNTLLIGGDLSSSESGLVIDSTIIGTVPKGGSIMRQGAQPGDLIFVSGALGAAAGGLKLLESGVVVDEMTSEHMLEVSEWQNSLIYEQLSPTPNVLPDLRNFATAMIDISDGLSGDLRHLCRASEVGARIDATSIPIHESIQGFRLAFEQELDLALHGGEDFKLLFTASSKKKSELIKKGFVLIGEVTNTPENIELVLGKESRQLPFKSHSHF